VIFILGTAANTRDVRRGMGLPLTLGTSGFGRGIWDVETAMIRAASRFGSPRMPLPHLFQAAFSPVFPFPLSFNLPSCILLTGRLGGFLHGSPGLAPQSGQGRSRASLLVVM
jgi:hypothetical protein